MLQQEIKILRDSVHGYIRIPKDYIQMFVDTEIFQRLRYIEQTGMRVLYPSARHDRFIHSLGTFHLGQKAFSYFRENVKRDYYNSHYNVTHDETNERFWDRCKILFEIACLLHDCGHAPFSHTLEFLYDVQDIDRNDSLYEILVCCVGTERFKSDFKQSGAPHERMSALIICNDFRDNINNILVKYNLLDAELNDYIEFIVRMIIGCRYSQRGAKYYIKNCLISLLNSDSIDVDSLDYIIRDSKLSGIDNMNIDIERLLSSLNIVEITECNGARFSNQQISANIIDGRLEKFNRKQASFIGKCQGELICNTCKGEVNNFINMCGNMLLGDDPVFSHTGTYTPKITVNGAPFYWEQFCHLSSHATISMSGNLSENLPFDGTKINFLSDTNCGINIKAQEISFPDPYIDGKLSGKFTGRILGNYSDIQDAQLELALGFNKNALSIIQNVIIARNYEYQWVYSHHKVVYYSNYLIIDLFYKCFEFLTQFNDIDNSIIYRILCWKNMISPTSPLLRTPFAVSPESYAASNPVSELPASTASILSTPVTLGNNIFFRPSDFDIISLFKYCYLNNDHRSPRKLLSEFFNRKYKISLWKTYQEFQIFFTGLTRTQLTSIYKKLRENSSSPVPDLYGTIQISSELSYKLSTFGLEDVVWIDGKVKLKQLKPDHTFIIYKDKTLTFRSVEEANQSYSNDTIKNNKNFFYLYYTPNRENDSVDLVGLKNFLINIIM